MAAVINSTRCKTSPVDKIPTVVLKRCVGIFAPSLAHLANLSFTNGVVPARFKLGHVILLIKKAGSDVQDHSNYLPITNLVTISKILERLVLVRIRPHVHMSKQFSLFQSAYRRRHSTETALIRVVNDLNSSMESGSKSILLSLDISATFDTIDTDKLLQRLESDFGIGGSASSHADRVMWPWVTTSPMFGVVILAFLRGVSSGLSSSPPSCLPSPGSSRHQVSSVRRRYPTLHGGEILGLNPDGGTLKVRCSPDVLVSRQWATVEFQQNRSHAFWYKAGSIQAWPSFLLGHRRQRPGEGKHQNPWCSS